MLVIDRATVESALDSYNEIYAQGRKWLIKDKIAFYSKAQSALQQESNEQLEELIAQLRSYWQAFRAGATSLSNSEIVRLLAAQDQRLRAASLMSAFPAHTKDLLQLVQACARIKSNKYGPSVVAMSKVLHAWNPKLFVVVDQEVMWGRVLGRVWLWRDFERHRRELFAANAIDRNPTNDEVCDVHSYVAILSWSAMILKHNLHIKEQFMTFVSKHAEEPQCGFSRIADLDAVALEWVLLGLAELPPRGVQEK